MNKAWMSGVCKISQLWALLSLDCFVIQVQKVTFWTHLLQGHILYERFRSNKKGCYQKVIEFKWPFPIHILLAPKYRAHIVRSLAIPSPCFEAIVVQKCMYQLHIDPLININGTYIYFSCFRVLKCTAPSRPVESLINWGFGRRCRASRQIGMLSPD